ncbi:MAG: hypothetical protein IJD04_01925 [Desulfovibrionaceae bacterium]|nr:hypothetical protein [Desulfovibrionaceae bacterium]
MLLCALVLLLLGEGCSSYSPTYLSGNPWQIDRPITQATNTLNFSYLGYTESGRESGLKGEAVIRPELLPPWASCYARAVIMVYVTDQRGRILEQHRQEYAPGTPVAQPLPFDFRLDSPSSLDDRNFYISFGYFLEISEFDPALSSGGKRLFRHEAEYK